MAKNQKKPYVHSMSSADIYKGCPRRWWYQYKGSYGGWDDQASEETKYIYSLKNNKAGALWLYNNLSFCIDRFCSGLNFIKEDEEVCLDDYIEKFESNCNQNEKQLIPFTPQDPTETGYTFDSLKKAGVRGIENFFSLALEENVTIIEFSAIRTYADSEGNEYYCRPPMIVKNQPHSNLFGLEPNEFYFLKFTFSNKSKFLAEENKIEQNQTTINTALYMMKAKKQKMIKTVVLNLNDNRYFVLNPATEEIKKFADFIKQEAADMRKKDALPFKDQTPSFNPIVCRECQYKPLCDTLHPAPGNSKK